jgi:hypothetical protein
VASAALLISVLAPPAARADAIPFTDQNAQGAVGLCDSNGHPIRSGSMSSHAFVAAAASSLAAPSGYGPKQGGKATLYAFQPRKDVNPGEWSGYQMTGGSVFSDGDHPLVSGTNLDPSLQDFISSFPARWNGLVQLRIYYTAPNKVVSRRTYPAAVLKVQAGQWTALQAADISCDMSKVVSSEKLLLPASDFDPKHPAVTHAPAPKSPVSAAHRSSSAAASGSGSMGGTPTATASAQLSPVAASRKTSSSAAPWLGTAAVVVLVAVTAAFGWRARRRMGN